MFDRFTDGARRAIVGAQEEARLLNHNYVGTEHLLLGLLVASESLAAEVLVSLGVTIAVVRQRVEEIIGRGGTAPSGYLPFTPRAKRVLELSLREAIRLDHDFIRPEHVLLGILSEGEGVAVQIVAMHLGADPRPTARAAVLERIAATGRP